jgi:putative membrane protein
MGYLILKALHLIAVISWMAALLYLPRLFVYHAGVAPGSEASETFKVMERRLLKAIATPAMVASWGLGFWLLIGYDRVDWSHDLWFYVKLAAVVALSAYHGMLARWRKDFAADRNTRSARFYRIANEVPTVLMIVTVFMVIVRPF